MGRKYQKGRQNIKTPNSGKRTGGGGGGGRGMGVNRCWALRGALDGMSTECYSVFWQIEHQ